MASSQEFNDGLRIMAEFVDTIGDEIVQDLSGQTDQGASIDGYQCRHGSHQYQIIGTQIWEYFTIRYPYNAAQHHAALSAAADAKLPSPEGAQEIQVDVDDAAINRSISEIRDEIKSDELDETRLDLMELLSEPGFAPNLEMDQELITGFTIDKKVFPYGDGFDISDFENAVQGIVSIGWLGKEYLMQVYGIKDLGEDLGLPGESPSGDPGNPSTPTPGFQ